MKDLKDHIRRRFPAVVSLLYRLRHADRLKELGGRTPRQIFTDYYHSAHWQSGISLSGGGSDYERTKSIREALPVIFERYGIKSLLDVPCGDVNWMQHVDLHRVKYIGGDIVGEMINDVRARFGGPGKQFLELDLIKDELPEADLLLCRDCLVHLSFSDLRQTVENVRRSKIRFILATTFSEFPYNRDILTGQWRPLNLQKPPFLWPEPMMLINEPTDEGDGGFKDKALGLWHVEDVRFT